MSGVSDLVSNHDLSTEEMLQAIADIIPLGWEYPDVSCARITLNGREFATDNFKETIWKLSETIAIYGTPCGAVDVCYMEQKPEADEGPF